MIKPALFAFLCFDLGLFVGLLLDWAIVRRARKHSREAIATSKDCLAAAIRSNQLRDEAVYLLKKIAGEESAPAKKRIN